MIEPERLLLGQDGGPGCDAIECLLTITMSNDPEDMDRGGFENDKR